MNRQNTSWLNSVALGSWSYTSGNNKGFLLRENSGLSLKADTTYRLQLEPGGILRVRDSLYWQIWVDLNGDQHFNDANERVYRGKSTPRVVHKGVVTLPATVNQGISRMRIIYSLNSWAQGPCDTSPQVVETEDYIINLQASQTCKTPSKSSIVLGKVTNSTVSLKALGLDVTKYQWEVRPATSDHLTFLSHQLSVDSVYFNSLAQNTRYQVRFRTLCKNGVYSAWSDTLTFKTLNVYCASPDSSSLKAVQVTHQSAVLQCGIVEGAAFYEFYYRAKNTANWLGLSLKRAPSATLSGLQPNTVYELRARVFCKANLSEYSAYSKTTSFKTNPEPCKGPDTNSFVAKLVTDVSATLSCALVPETIVYVFSYRKVGDSTLHSINGYSGNTQVTNLEPDTRYEFTVQSYCKINDQWTISMISAYRQFTTLPKICPPVAHAAIQVEDVGAGKMQASCPPGAELYTWRYRIAGSSTWADSITLDTSIWVISGLEYPEQYEIEVKQKCVAGNWSAWSTTKKFHTPNLHCPTPAAQNIQIIAKGDTIHFAYAGAQAASYHWRMRIAGDSLWSTISGTNLEQGIVFNRAATYEIAIQAVCANDTSEWSKSKTLIWPCSAVERNEITIREVNIQFASIHCTAPSIDGYRWRYRELGQSNWQEEIFTLPGDVLFEQLSAAKTYEFQVQRYCSDLASTYAESQFFTTPPLPVVTDCGLLPTQLSIKELGPGRVELKHVPGPRQYFWAYRPYNQLDWEVQFTATSNMVEIDSLVPGQAYIFGTRISCGVGDTIDWVYLTYYPSCTNPVAADIRVTAQGDEGAVLECNNYNFIAYKWRYRTHGSNDDWNYANGNRAVLTQLVEKLYEVQVQGFCQQSGNWTPWSDSKLFRVGKCKLPASFTFAPKFIQAGAVEVLLESKSTTDWGANHFKWSYRENGRATWTDNILTEDPLLSVSGLIPGEIYEFKVEATCIASSPSTLVHGEYIFLPKACFTPPTDRIKVERITKNSAYIKLDYFTLYLPFDILYRVRGSQTAFEIFPFVNDIPNLPGLSPGTEYEVVLRIKCDGDSTVETAPVYFKTKSCEIPYAGAIAFDEIGVDFVEAHVESHHYHPPVDAVNYEWKYKLKSATTWESVLADTQNRLYLDALQPESDYDLKAVLHCPNAYSDSIAFVAGFKTTLDECSTIESSKDAVVYRYIPSRKDYGISCTLPDDYYFSVRFWVRFEPEQDDYYWEFSVSDSLQCGWVLFMTENTPNNTFYFQTRILCPGGNYSPWSDTIALTVRENQFNKMLAEKLAELQREEAAKHAKLLLSPNPTPGQFKVVLPSVESAAPNHQLEIFNLSGQKVYSKKLEGSEANIDLSGQPAGLYFLKANVGNQVFTERILVQKH